MKIKIVSFQNYFLLFSDKYVINCTNLAKKKNDIPLVLPKLNINNREIARTESIKFLSVFLDENTYKIHRK